MEIKKICQWCGKSFITQKTTTCYCSLQCSKRGYKHRMMERKMELRHMQEMQELRSSLEKQEYFTFSQVARLMRVSRQYIYKLGKEEKLRASWLSGKKSLIRRVDIDLMLNAEHVARNHGWTTAVEVRSTHVHQVNSYCIKILREMPSWSWEEYREALVRRGYSVVERRDSKEVLRGYSFRKGEAKYKASELGVARNLMVSKLPRTWQKLHYREALAAQANPAQSRQPEPVQRPAAATDYTCYRPGLVFYTLPAHDGREQRFYIPERVLDCFNEEFDYREVANSRELTDMAVAMFVGMLDAPAAWARNRE